MYNDHGVYQYHYIAGAPSPDPLDEFLAQLLNDVPDVLPSPVTTYVSVSSTTPSPPPPPPPPPPTFFSTPSLPSSSSAVSAGTTIVPYYTPDNAPLVCQWLTPSDNALVCGTSLPADPKYACAHLRQAHQIRGNEKVMVQCRWRDCHVAPMQRGSLVRHVLTVHLCLLKWRCEMCGRTFARKGTAHACRDDEDR